MQFLLFSLPAQTLAACRGQIIVFFYCAFVPNRNNCSGICKFWLTCFPLCIIINTCKRCITHHQPETKMSTNELKAKIETMAKDEGKTPLQIISLLQTGAAKTGNDALLDQLCEIKWDYI